MPIPPAPPPRGWSLTPPATSASQPPPQAAYWLWRTLEPDFVNLGYSKLDTNMQMAANDTNTLWSVDQQTGRLTTAYGLDLQGSGIANVRSVLPVNGTWGIDERGNLTAATVTAKKLCLEEVCVEKEQLKSSSRTPGSSPSRRQPLCLRAPRTPAIPQPLNQRQPHRSRLLLMPPRRRRARRRMAPPPRHHPRHCRISRGLTRRSYEVQPRKMSSPGEMSSMATLDSSSIAIAEIHSSRERRYS